MRVGTLRGDPITAGLGAQPQRGLGPDPMVRGQRVKLYQNIVGIWFFCDIDRQVATVVVETAQLFLSQFKKMT